MIGKKKEDNQNVEEQAKEYFNNKKNQNKAEGILKDNDKLNDFLSSVECKLAEIPGIGSKLKDIPVLFNFIKDSMLGEYKKAPFKSILASTMALIYFVNPMDIIPDIIPVIGYVDDATVVAIAIKMVQSDLNEYRQWKNSEN